MARLTHPCASPPSHAFLSYSKLFTSSLVIPVPLPYATPAFVHDGASPASQPVTKYCADFVGSLVSLARPIAKHFAGSSFVHTSEHTCVTSVEPPLMTTSP